MLSNEPSEKKKQVSLVQRFPTCGTSSPMGPLRIFRGLRNDPTGTRDHRLKIPKLNPRNLNKSLQGRDTTVLDFVHKEKEVGSESGRREVWSVGNTEWILVML